MNKLINSGRKPRGLAVYSARPFKCIYKDMNAKALLFDVDRIIIYYKEQRAFSIVIAGKMGHGISSPISTRYPVLSNKIKRIRSGGQSGVDRAAMDIAREYGIPLCGWCPKGGWAEDYPSAPGLLRDYPELTETPSEGTRQRTEWNMRDADAILTIIPEGSQPSPGTDVGLVAGETLDKPMLTVSGIEDVSRILTWLSGLPDGIELCVGGPRASECAQAYRIAKEVLASVFERLSDLWQKGS